VRAGAAVAVFVVVALASGGCGDSSGENLSENELAKLVVQPSDVPRLSRFQNEREIMSQQSPVLGRDPHRFGRQNGWVARYRRPRGSNGPLILASGVDMFAKRSGASDFFGKVTKVNEANAAGSGMKSADGDDLGDERQVLATPSGRPGSVRFVLAVWRTGRFVGSISASGYSGRISSDDVVALAKRADRRLATAD
jgi:hypothetical protein